MIREICPTRVQTWTLCLIVALTRGAVPATAAQMEPKDEAPPDRFTTTDSGLKYRILRKGKGQPPKPADTVKVHYKGWLQDGTVIDDSRERGAPVAMPLNAVIAGWTEGVQLIGRGGLIELEIPSQLAYGERGAGKVPPNATLHFLIELFGDDVRLEPAPSDPDAPKEFTTADSGVKYRIRRRGAGRRPKPGDVVTLHYKGWLDNGTVFDESYNSGKPVSLEWSQVDETWTGVLQKVARGGAVELVIPADLGYGAQGAGDVIPPNATLHFIIELIDIQ